MSTLPSPDTPQTDQLGPDTEDPNKERNKELLAQVKACKNYRRKKASKWDTNIDYRQGKPFATTTDVDRINVNIDWSITKDKQAALFSQVPVIRVNHPPQSITIPWVHQFEQRVNDTLVSAGIESVMEEVLPDCINAAGFGAAIVSREALSVDIDIPTIDLSFFNPQEQQQIISTKTLPDGSPLPTISIPRVIDQRYIITRISPKDFLWPIDFDGSDFERAPWIGRSGKMTWTEAKKRFNLKEEDKHKYVSGPVDERYRERNSEKDSNGQGDNIVTFDEIFYKEFQFNADATSFLTIHHLIYLGNEKDPVIDEPWKGQRVSPDGKVIGCIKFPIRVLTLTYLTDEAIPPSDSEIIRPQVDELNASRTQALMQRRHSLPVRWVDINRVDPAIQMALMRGVWQHMIPIQGNGSSAIGEVQRSQMPQENYLFDKTTKADIKEIVQLGPIPDMEKDSPGSESMSSTRLTKERARVSKFVTDIAETVGGLICLYDEPGSFGEGFDPNISKTLSYSIVTDSTVLMDTNQRLQRLFQFINFTAKSGWVNIEAVLKEIATLSGLDPNLVIQKPEPRPPSEPNISLRLTGTEDLLNPLALAHLIHSGQAPTVENIKQAKYLIEESVTPIGGNQINPILLGMMLKSGQLPMDMLPPPDPNAPPEALPPAPSAKPLPVGGANPEWSTMNKVNKRSDEEES